MQELKCIWLLECEDLHHKAYIGQSLGYEKELPLILNRRLSELFNVDQRILMPIGFEEQMSYLHKQFSLPDVCKLLQKSLASWTKKQLDKTEAVADEPSKLLLTSIHEILLSSYAKIGETTLTGIDLQLGQLTNIEFKSASPVVKLLAYPARSDKLTYKDGQDFDEQDSSDLKLVKFIHSIAVNIEICAMEVCAFNILTYKSMPLDFKADMAQQIWDEARHFILLADYLESHMGTVVGQYCYNFDVWNKHQLGDGLEEQLAIEQVIQEGDAVGNNMGLIFQLKQRGIHEKLQAILEYINADESMHTKNGNKWLNYICQRKGLNYMDILKTTSQKINKKLPGKFQLHESIYQFLEFPDEYITYTNQAFQNN
ncbi:DUF455 family protein [Pseudoalteromonas aurantia]|uniref:DUF455 family protein n=1 Tax=Pseudoalteromonas aurantia TaxID=43654 RepID=UPI0014874E0C|nr:DUF455 family protein [Pseudoalteromonas aurantia]